MIWEYLILLFMALDDIYYVQHAAFLEQVEGTTQVAQMPSQPFKHPVDIGDLQNVTCSDCHTGGVGP